jgi:DNA modification methylase
MKNKSVVTAKKTAEWTIQFWPLDKFKPYDRNPRKNDQAVDRMCEMIKEYGFKIPVLVLSSGEVVDGHLRLKAATKLATTEVPVLLCDEWTPAQVKGFRIMVNASANWASWDTDLLHFEMLALKDLQFDLKFTGFDADQVAGYLTPRTTGKTDEDLTPPPPKVATTQPGDLWILGSHRLLCGDSTLAKDVFRVLDGVRPVVMVTDPPYGVNYDANWRNAALAGKPRADGRPGGGGRAIGKVSNDNRADWQEAYELFPGDVAYVWHAGLYGPMVAANLEAAGYQLRSQIIWAKSHFAIGRGAYHWQHEPCWYAVREAGAGHWLGGRKQATLWQIGKPQKSETGHSTQKPVECMRRPLANHAKEGQHVYDPFMGSGTTIIACETTARIAIGVEIDPVYCDVAVKRWEDFTGKRAKLDRNGQ